MFKFFNKIRRNQLLDGKSGKPFLPSSKYFKYAIGEIILVVIGIMIALQLNNWNQNNQKKELEIINLKALKKNLTDDLEIEINPGLKYYLDSKQAQQDIIKHYQNSQGLSNDSLTNLYKTWLRRDWRFVFNSAAFENIKSIGIDIISNDSLRASVSSIYNHLYPNVLDDNISSINYFEQQVLLKINDNTNQFDSTFSNKDLEFLNNNVQFKNRIEYMTRLRNYLNNDLLTETKNQVVHVITKIDEELKKK